MRVLGMDCATVTGWAWSDGSTTRSGHFKTKKSGEATGQRLVNFWNFIQQFTGCVDFVCFEAARVTKFPASFQTISELNALLMLWCEQQKIPYAGFSPSEFKKFATGRGNATKEDMVKAAQRFDPTITDDNQADALHIMHFALAQVLSPDTMAA